MDKSDYKALRIVFNTQDKLKDYTPKDKYFTSKVELDYISNLLNLTELNVDELRSLRNIIVLFYDNLRNGLDRNSRKWEDYWQGMLSVTAVIDHISHGATA
jgi:hypothetical protein